MGRSYAYVLAALLGVFVVSVAPVSGLHDDCGDVEAPPNTDEVTADPHTDDYLCIPLDTDNGTSNPVVLSPRTVFEVDITNISGSDEPGNVRLVYDSTSGDVDTLEESCVQRKGSVLVRIFMDRDEVEALTDLKVDLEVGSVTKRIQFYPTGLNLAGCGSPPLPYTLDNLPVYLSFFVLDGSGRPAPITPSHFSVCKVSGEEYTAVNDILLLERVDSMICSTFKLPNDQLLLEVDMVLKKENNNELVQGLFGDGDSFQVVALFGDCMDKEQLSKATPVTITRPGPTTTVVTPEPTQEPTTTGTTSTNTTVVGLGGGAIAGIVAAVLLPIATAVAIFFVVVWIKKRKSKDDRDPEAVEMAESPAHVQEEPPKTTPEEVENRQGLMYVWNLLYPEVDDMDLLGSVNIPDTVKADVARLTSFIRHESCDTFYLVRKGGRDKLQATNEVAWKLLVYFNTRSFSSELLQKLIDVRLYERREGGNNISEVVEGPILTVNIPLDKWQSDPKQCVKLIKDKVKLNRRVNDFPDGAPPSHTPSHTESPPRPTTAELATSETLQTSADPASRSAPPSAAARQSPGPSSHEQPPPYYGPSLPALSPTQQTQQQPPHTGTMNDPHWSEFLGKLGEISKHVKRSADANERIADNTGQMAERQEDTQAVAEAIHDAFNQPQEDAPEGL